MSIKKTLLSLWLIAAVTSSFAQKSIKNAPKQQSSSEEYVMKRLTSGTHEDMVPYFTSNSITADDKYMIFLRIINDCNNIWALNLETGEEKQITYFTDVSPNSLRIYEFRQHDYPALNIASVVMHAKTGKVYFLKDRKLWRFDLNGNGRVLATLPSKVDISNCHVNDAGTKFLLSTVDDRAFDLLDANVTNNLLIDEYIQQRNLSSHLMVYDTDNGDCLLKEEVHSAWVSHAQFSPVDDNIILYNHEWCPDDGIRRIWIFDGRRHIRMRNEEDGRSRHDGASHETWEPETGNIIYHGSYPNGVKYIGRMAFKDPHDPSDYTITEIPLPPECKKYGHFSVNHDGSLLVSDGHYAVPGEKNSWGGEWITLFKPDWEKKTIELKPLCRHRSSWKNQEAHPHPVFNHAGTAIFFTSDFEGRRAVYKVDVDTPNEKNIKSVMLKVAEWQLAHPKHDPRAWTNGAFYAGLFAAWETTRSASLYQSLLNICNSIDWTPSRWYHADDVAVCQTFIDLYRKEKRQAMIQPTIDTLSLLLTKPYPESDEVKVCTWWWCDALFMAPPALVKLGVTTGNQEFLQKNDKLFRECFDLLYNKEEHLFARDNRYLANNSGNDMRESNGKRIFWSRGNGWVMGGLTRILKELPQDYPQRPFYENLFREMAAKIISIQQPDGLWRSSLLDPDAYPGGEVSGSGFYCYALAWGINNNLLDRATFLPSVRKAWAGLNKCVNEEGRVGWVQPVGQDPRLNYNADSWEVYGTGAFLLAGSEVIKLK